MVTPKLEHAALLIIDMQVALYSGAQAPYQGETIVARINTLLDKAHVAAAPVFLARHVGPASSPIAIGSPGWALLPALQVAASDQVFDKQKPSCFAGTALQSMLDKAGVKTLVIAGMKTQYCVDTTCRMAADLGYQVILVADAHTCMDTEALPAKAIIDHHNATLAGPFAQLRDTEQVLF